MCADAIYLITTATWQARISAQRYQKLCAASGCKDTREPRQALFFAAANQCISAPRGLVRQLTPSPQPADHAANSTFERCASYTKSADPLHSAYTTQQGPRPPPKRKDPAPKDGAPSHDPRGPLRHAASKDVEGPQEVETGSREGKISGAEARSRRPAMLRRLHAIDATRVHHTRSWVVSFSSLRPFGPRRCSAQAHRRAPVLRALQVLRAAVAFVD